MTIKEYCESHDELIDIEDWPTLLKECPTECRIALQLKLLECGATKEELADAYVDVTTYENYLKYCLQQSKEHFDDEQEFVFEISPTSCVRLCAEQSSAFDDVYAFYSKSSIDYFFSRKWKLEEYDLYDFTECWINEDIMVDAQIEVSDEAAITKLMEYNRKYGFTNS